MILYWLPFSLTCRWSWWTDQRRVFHTSARVNTSSYCSHFCAFCVYTTCPPDTQLPLTWEHHPLTATITEILSCFTARVMNKQNKRLVLTKKYDFRFSGGPIFVNLLRFCISFILLLPMKTCQKCFWWVIGKQMMILGVKYRLNKLYLHVRV